MFFYFLAYYDMPLLKQKVVTLFEFLMHICGFTSEQTFLRLIDVWFMISVFLFTVFSLYFGKYLKNYLLIYSRYTKDFDKIIRFVV